MDYALCHHGHDEPCNCPMTLEACAERKLKRKMSDLDYLMTIKEREIQTLESDMRKSRTECKKLREENLKRAEENNNLLNENQILREDRQRLTDQLGQATGESEPEEDLEENPQATVGRDQTTQETNTPDGEAQRGKDSRNDGHWDVYYLDGPHW